ncbi:MAG: hypothetical protein D6706_05750 [Chloroflexi bacterium]|nr:MAG: hypothetical protein D6706_05750 [Chloroflexota bacterium]
MTETIRHALVLEPDQNFASRLVAALGQIGVFAVAVVHTINEGVSQLARQRFDVAFIPVSSDARAVDLLRQVQPDLRLIVTTPSPDYALPEVYLGNVQGVLLRSHVQADLAAVVAEAMKQPLPQGVADSSPEKQGETAVFDELLQQIRIGRRIQAVVLTKGDRLVTFHGYLHRHEAILIASKVSETRFRTTRIQFLHLPGRAGELMLFTRHISQSYFLTLAAMSEVSLSWLREQSNRIMPALARLVKGAVPPHLAEEKRLERQSYAMVWRPIRPLPASLQVSLRRALSRLAEANHCELHYLSVNPLFIHMVVTCPPGRDSTWAAYQFKNGSEEIIQQEFGVTVRIWEPGFHATASSNPLPEPELSLMLQKIEATNPN